MIDPKKYNIMIWATRPYSVMWGQGYCGYLTRYGTEFLCLARTDGGKADYFTDKDSFEEACRRFGKDLLENSRDFLDKYEIRKKKVFDISIQLSKKAGRVSDKKLAEIYSEYWEIQRDFEPYLMFVHFTERFLEPMMKEKFPEQFDIITGLSKPLEYLNMEKASFTKSPKEMAKRFGYLNTYAFLGEPYDEKFFRDYKADRKELQKKLSDIAENKRKFDVFIKTMKGEDKRLCELLNGMVFIRTDRIDAWKRHSVMLYPFITYLAKKISPKIGKDEIAMMTRDEINNLLLHGKHPSVKELLIRSKSQDFMVIFTRKGIKMIDDAKLKRDIIKRYEDSIRIDKVVRGMSACKGIIKGIVKIYTGPKSIGKDESGFIMVAKHTSPQDLPYMKKAIAIVTDEGGVTSHAAIVSRELNIPGIVGTKIATKSFKDGDYVEVDADNGIVRKIKPE